ncbi:MAG: hypothetical protein II821_05375 [Treponema sp.]|nr:hypothetical protein [Treponema sp.]
MKVIIADGSAVVRALIEHNLDTYHDINIISFVPNGKRLIEAIDDERPNVVVSGLDINDPVEKESLRVVTIEKRVPVVLLSNLKTKPANLVGVDIIERPGLPGFNQEFFQNLVKHIRNRASPSYPSATDEKPNFKILCLGASTGGPSAVMKLLSSLGNNFPLPILYAQHIDVGADKNMAEWFASVCHNIKVKLAENGEEAKPGIVYMAPADKHLVIDFVRQNGNPILKLSDEEPERFLRPAVNKLFRSAAKNYKKNCLAVLLTGMGSDGAEGCREICENGGWTIAEDKSTCAVFGMPAAAIELGAAREVLPRPDISKRILELVKK